MAVLYDVPAPAKINLFLHVTGRRADGYHLLETAFRFIELCDTLSFDLRRDGQICREGEGLQGLAQDDDLVVRAARALQAATGTPLGAQIRYQKNIPSGAGLGGGSSDAATTLIALNKLWNTGLDRQTLASLGLGLGADVPVFIYGRPAFAQGIGEQFSPLELPAQRAYLVVQPPQQIPTHGIFSSPDLTRDSPSVKMSVFTDWQRFNAPSRGFYEHGLFGRNDLESVVFAKYPRVQAVGRWLSAQGLSARMSGSGSCFFIEFVTMEEAALCQKQIRGKIFSRRSESGGDSAAVIKNSWVCPGLIDHPLRHWISS